jgi:hypothetical protein
MLKQLLHIIGQCVLCLRSTDLPKPVFLTPDPENREYVRRDSSRWSLAILYPQKLARTSPTSCGRSVGIVRSHADSGQGDFSFFFLTQRWNGWSFQRILAQMFSLFSSDYYTPEDHWYGSYTDSGAWNGLIGMIVRNEVHVANVDMIWTTDRGDVVDFITQIHQDR